MRRILLAAVGTTTGLVMLLGFKTHPLAAAPALAATRVGTTSSATSTAASSGGSATRTVTGDTVDTQWGPVQVQITLRGKNITDAQAVQYPSGNPHDAEINSWAIPQLNSEAVAADSAHIDMVSGATYTSGGYLQSLQSALDKAGV